MSSDWSIDEFRDALSQARQLLAPLVAEAARDRGRALERVRIRSIILSPQALGREKRAARLAFITDVPAETVRQLLTKAPIESSPAAIPTVQTKESPTRSSHEAIIWNSRRAAPGEFESGGT